MIQIEGYAVICENDCIADAQGGMPEALKSEAEWAFFQAGLARADVVVLGRKSHEVTPNPAGRCRLVLTRRVEQAEWEDARTVLWNPAGAGLEIALSMFEVGVATLAVTGGRDVFDYFLTQPAGYTSFHLSRIKGTYLKGGTKVFSGLSAGDQTPESFLRARGYRPSHWRKLDEVASVVSWLPLPVNATED